jgi:hypothetical protein
MGADKVMVRMYTTESRARVDRLMELVHSSRRLPGITVFRGVAGFGMSTFIENVTPAGADAPVVIEFIDDPETVDESVRYVCRLIAPRHVVSWPVRDMLAIDGAVGASVATPRTPVPASRATIPPTPRAATATPEPVRTGVPLPRR